MAFSDTLRLFMSQKGIKAVDLSRLTGLSEAIISEYLSGKKEPRGKQSVSIACALGISLDELWQTEYAPKNQTAPAVMPGLNSDEAELIKMFRSYSDEDRHALLLFAEYIAARATRSQDPTMAAQVSLANRFEELARQDLQQDSRATEEL